ncbi:ABC transporter permease [Paeniglutamicibacter sp. MACA_103]|uniref:ABC transporter permease n=1 Tax=Paeniglutamicibacter sp. MACA_103 TaxID=3377337 RepID=UPI003895274D
MNWLWENPGQARALTLEHLYLSIIPTVVGVVLALALGLVFGNRPRTRALITGVASAIFTIPSLALFVVIPSIIGTQILDPLNVVIALSLYSTSLLVRTVFDALDAVAPEVLNAAEALGYSRARRRVFVDLPLAVAPLAAGTRVAAVTNVSLVSVGAVIGVGGLGQLFVAGYQRNYPDQILAGIIVILLLALLLDRIIAGAARLLTPWLHHGAAPAASADRRRPFNGRASQAAPSAQDAAGREGSK